MLAETFEAGVRLAAGAFFLKTHILKNDIFNFFDEKKVFSLVVSKAQLLSSHLRSF